MFASLKQPESLEFCKLDYKIIDVKCFNDGGAYISSKIKRRIKR
jgi:hypothetical protein